MLFSTFKSKRTLFFAFVLLASGACKQSEFYEKADLMDPTKQAEKNPDGTGVNLPGGTPSAGDTTTGGTVVDPGTGTGLPTTPPPVVVVDPGTGSGAGGGTTTTPGTTDPGTTLPPVILPPVISPPVVSSPVNCQGAWSSCTVACGGGTQTYSISVIPANGGLSCEASNGSTKACNIQACPVNLVDKSEIFTQDSTRDGDVDILWVIDDSGSMADNQDNLARNFDSFINQFLLKNIDFKMAITTTDGTSTRNGKMVGDSSMLTHAAAVGNKTAFTNNFSKWVKVGTSGSGIEQGLKTASSFLDRYSSSYLRSDAYLAIVVLSDEEDQSDKKVSEYVARFQAAKKNAGMVKVYSIVTEKLPFNRQWETIGKRYLAATTATSGLHADITSSFANTLNNIGASIVNLIDHFALAGAPYDNKITVLVNNVQVDAGWTYDSVAHTLKFNTGSVPAEGSKIEVRYKVNAQVLGAI